jgi:hypothetical protein
LTRTGYPLEDLVLGKDSTWTRWEGGGSPRSHMVLEPRHLRAILHSGAFFARKFPPGADVGNWGLHRPAMSGPAGVATGQAAITACRG